MIGPSLISPSGRLMFCELDKAEDVFPVTALRLARSIARAVWFATGSSKTSLNSISLGFTFSCSVDSIVFVYKKTGCIRFGNQQEDEGDDVDQLTNLILHGGDLLVDRLDRRREVHYGIVHVVVPVEADTDSSAVYAKKEKERG